MALQLAWARLHKEPTAVYETASARFFKHGRTETCRSLTSETWEFASNFDNINVLVSQTRTSIWSKILICNLHRRWTTRDNCSAKRLTLKSHSWEKPLRVAVLIDTCSGSAAWSKKRRRRLCSRTPHMPSHALTAFHQAICLLELVSTVDLDLLFRMAMVSITRLTRTQWSSPSLVRRHAKRSVRTSSGALWNDRSRTWWSCFPSGNRVNLFEKLVILTLASVGLMYGAKAGRLNTTKKRRKRPCWRRWSATVTHIPAKTSNFLRRNVNGNEGKKYNRYPKTLSAPPGFPFTTNLATTYLFNSSIMTSVDLDDALDVHGKIYSCFTWCVCDLDS